MTRENGKIGRESSQATGRWSYNPCIMEGTPEGRVDAGGGKSPTVTADGNGPESSGRVQPANDADGCSAGLDRCAGVLS